jgi:hypothetical protein
LTALGVLQLQCDDPLSNFAFSFNSRHYTMALGLMFAAGGWPVKAFFELKNGTLTAPASEITVSPR